MRADVGRRTNFQSDANHSPVALDPWLTLVASRDYTEVSDSTLRREIAAGRLRAARVGGRKAIRIRRSWLDRWLEDTAEPVEGRRR